MYESHFIGSFCGIAICGRTQFLYSLFDWNWHHELLGRCLRSCIPGKVYANQQFRCATIGLFCVRGLEGIHIVMTVLCKSKPLFPGCNWKALWIDVIGCSILSENWHDENVCFYMCTAYIVDFSPYLYLFAVYFITLTNNMAESPKTAFVCMVKVCIRLINVLELTNFVYK